MTHIATRGSPTIILGSSSASDFRDHGLRLNAAHGGIRSLDDGTTKGELLEKMIEAYLRGSSTSSAPAPKADLAEGRTQPIPVYATPDLADALEKRAKRHGWTVSGVIEHACAIAAKCEERG